LGKVFYGRQGEVQSSPQGKLKISKRWNWISIREAAEKKDQPNKVMVSLSNKVTAQLC